MRRRMAYAGVLAGLAVALVLAPASGSARAAEPTRQDEHGEHEDHGGHAERGGHDDHGKHDEHGEHDDHATEFTVAAFVRHGVGLATAGPGVVDVGIELPGEVRPNADRTAHLAPRFPGLVREVRHHVGDAVAAGDVLAVIETDHLSRYELRTALAGTVIDKHITPGETVLRDRAAFIVADLATVWIEISVHQGALDLLRVGQPVTLVASQGAAEAEGAVSYVSPVVDQTTRAATARVVLPNPDGTWRPGLFVTATVFDPVPAAVVVPRRALHRLEGATVVFVVEDERFVARPVALGYVGRTHAEVANGVAAGERFADTNSFLVKADLAKGAAGHDH